MPESYPRPIESESPSQGLHYQILMSSQVETTGLSIRGQFAVSQAKTTEGPGGAALSNSRNQDTDHSQGSLCSPAHFSQVSAASPQNNSPVTWESLLVAALALTTATKEDRISFSQFHIGSPSCSLENGHTRVMCHPSACVQMLSMVQLGSYSCSYP